MPGERDFRVKSFFEVIYEGDIWVIVIEGRLLTKRIKG